MTRLVMLATVVGLFALTAATPVTAAQPAATGTVTRAPDESATAPAARGHTQTQTQTQTQTPAPPGHERATPSHTLLQAPPAQLRSPTPQPPRFALAVNLPFHWLRGSIGVSGYVQIAPGLAVRLNAAHSSGAKWKLLNGEFTALVDDTRAMRIAEGAVALIWFPHRDFTGPAVEAGALLRSYRSTSAPANATEASHGRILAARVALGWFWPIGKRWFASVNVGASRGYAWRNVNAQPTNSLGRDLEGFVRWGIRW